MLPGPLKAEMAIRCQLLWEARLPSSLYFPLGILVWISFSFPLSQPFPVLSPLSSDSNRSPQPDGLLLSFGRFFAYNWPFFCNKADFPTRVFRVRDAPFFLFFFRSPAKRPLLMLDKCLLHLFPPLLNLPQPPNSRSLHCYTSTVPSLELTDERAFRIDPPR